MDFTGDECLLFTFFLGLFRKINFKNLLNEIN